jgi:hypothetical protein
MYVYIKTEPRLWTVGFFTPDGRREAETDYSSPEEAATRVHWLNGGRIQELIQQQAPEQEIER